MTDSPPGLAALLWGTVLLRPYVVVFLTAFLVASSRDLGVACTLGFLGWGFAVAFVAEYASTRVGIPFGLYHYTGDTAAVELFLANVPLFDALSFPFLSYASFCLARVAVGPERRLRLALLAGTLMMLLDVVIDPIAVRGDRWFLGRIFYYDAGGAYFGVPLSNFAGWLLVGWLIVGGYLLVTPRAPDGHGRAAPWPGVGLYYGMLLFNFGITWWIGEVGLLLAGILVHVGAFLLLYGASARLTPLLPEVPSARGRQARDVDRT